MLPSTKTSVWSNVEPAAGVAEPITAMDVGEPVGTITVLFAGDESETVGGALDEIVTNTCALSRLCPW